ncbi:MAG: hypothetical protein AAF577_03630 [Pseudomonadota bacterium]
MEQADIKALGKKYTTGKDQVSQRTIRLSSAMEKALSDLADEEGLTLVQALERAVGTQLFIEEAKRRGDSFILKRGSDQKLMELTFGSKD